MECTNSVYLYYMLLSFMHTGRNARFKETSIRNQSSTSFLPKDTTYASEVTEGWSSYWRLLVRIAAQRSLSGSEIPFLHAAAPQYTCAYGDQFSTTGTNYRPDVQIALRNYQPAGFFPTHTFLRVFCPLHIPTLHCVQVYYTQFCMHTSNYLYLKLFAATTIKIVTHQ